jgi:hypothetical protein
MDAAESKYAQNDSNPCAESTATSNADPSDSQETTEQQSDHPLEISESNDATISGDTYAIQSLSTSTDLTTLQQMLSWEYIGLVAWFSACLVPMQYYIGSIGFQLEEKGDEDGFYASLFTIVYAGAALVAPLGGMVSDRLGLGWAQGVSTLFVAASFFVLSSRGTLPVQVVGLVCYGVGRMFVFGFYFGNIGKRFGYTHYGTLSGIGLFLSAIVSLLQYPLLTAAADGLPVNASVGIGLVCLIPYCVWLCVNERRIPMARTFWTLTSNRDDRDCAQRSPQLRTPACRGPVGTKSSTQPRCGCIIHVGISEKVHTFPL